MKHLGKVVVFIVMMLLLISSEGLVMSSPEQRLSEQNRSSNNRDYFYAYNKYDPSGGTLEGIITFDTPDDITFLAGGIFPNFCAAADMDEDGYWYGCDYAGGLYLIDQETGAQIYIAPTIAVNGMTYDTTTGTWYVTSGSSLYTMDVTTGATSFIAFLQGGMGDIICDLNGNMYGVSYNDSTTVLCVINKTTGMIEEIGPTGLSAVFDLVYDRNNDVVYSVGYSQSSATGFYICDVDTGECSLINGFEGGAEIDGVVNPYTVPSHFLAAHFSWTPSYPNPGTIILFNASRSIAVGGEVILYEWDWDADGTYDEAYNIPTVTHVWESPGGYPVTLRVTDDTGWTATTSHNVTVIRINHPPLIPSISGPTKGIINRTYDFTIGPLMDPDDDVLYCTLVWGDGNVSDWLGPYSSGQIISLAHTWTDVGVYEIRAKLKDIYGLESDWSEPHGITILENTPPEIPRIEGATEGNPGRTYLYNFETTDPENDDVSFYIDWGDTTNSGWLGPYASGVEKSTTHSWDEKGTYLVKIKAQDIYGAESDWATIEVTMPLSYEPLYFHFIEWLFEHFLNSFPILRYLLRFT